MSDQEERSSPAAARGLAGIRALTEDTSPDDNTSEKDLFMDHHIAIDRPECSNFETPNGESKSAYQHLLSTDSSIETEEAAAKQTEEDNMPATKGDVRAILQTIKRLENRVESNESTLLLNGVPTQTKNTIQMLISSRSDFKAHEELKEVKRQLDNCNKRTVKDKATIKRLERELEASNQRNHLSRDCLLYTSPSPRDVEESRMPSSA